MVRCENACAPVPAPIDTLERYRDPCDIQPLLDVATSRTLAVVENVFSRLWQEELTIAVWLL